jgi:putative heme transporter
MNPARPTPPTAAQSPVEARFASGVSQVSLKTVMTVAFGALAVWAGVEFVDRTILAITLTVASLMIAVALNHGVQLLVRRGVSRVVAIALVLLVCVGLVVGLGFTVIPTAATQGKALFMRLPEIFQSVRATRIFITLDQRLNLAERLTSLEQEVPKMLEGAAAPVMAVLGGVLSAVAALATVLVLTIFMLIFGGELVRGLLHETLPGRRYLYATVVEKIYRSIGGYLAGLGLICLVNATLTTTFMAIVGVPFFLPLGIVSGLSSLIPYAGPVVVGSTVTLIAFATKGTGIGVACGIYFLAYGQFEGQVLSPIIFRRTVHVNPLVVVLAILFFSELAGIFGAVVAVPAAATIQIVAREILRIRRERLHLAATPLNSPTELEMEAVTALAGDTPARSPGRPATTVPVVALDRRPTDKHEG